MNGLDRDALDRWITGGRHSSETLSVTCTHCGAESIVGADTEYGATTWQPEECPKCHEEWDEDAPWESYDPSDDEPADFDERRWEQ